MVHDVKPVEEMRTVPGCWAWQRGLLRGPGQEGMLGTRSDVPTRLGSLRTRGEEAESAFKEFPYKEELGNGAVVCIR